MSSPFELAPGAGVGRLRALNQYGQIAAEGFVDNEIALFLLTPVDQPPGDINHDCRVDTSDLLVLLSDWGSCPSIHPCLSDLDGDRFVGVLDFLFLLADWTY